MTEFQFTPETVETATPTPAWRRFPVVTQLGILLLLLGCLFGAVFIPKAKDLSNATPLPTAEPHETATASVAISPLGTITITGKAAFVYDVRTSRVLFAQEPDTVLPLASITKLMTSLVTTELLPDDTTVSISKKALAQDGASGFVDGEKISVDELRSYAMLASSNDAAYALSNAAGSAIDSSAPDQTFIKSMNLYAEELGLRSMKFYNATGLDVSTTQAGAYGSARDVSFLMAHILEQHPEILYSTTAKRENIYNNEGTYHEAENTNPIIDTIPNILGSKTGYTDLAGGNLTVAYDAGFDRPIIVTVLGSTYNERFADVTTIIKAIQAATITSNE